MTTKEFKEAFLTCPFWDEVFKEMGVMAIFLLGSQVTGVTDERSDYDLTIVCTNAPPKRDKRFLLFRGHKIHWYTYSYGQFVQTKVGHPLLSYMNVLFGFLTDECVIYINEEYREQMEKLISLKAQIALKGAKLFYKTQREFVQSLLEQGEIKEQDFTKFLGHLCVTKAFVFPEPLDNEKILKAKRIRWQPTSVEDRKWILQQLKLLEEWYAHYENS